MRIVLSIRSDFLDHVGEDRAFMDELARGLMFLQPLGRPELCEALTRPLDLHGYDFETDELVDRMLADLANVPGALPLLQFTAARLWDSRDRKNKHLTQAAYAEMGGVSGALATHADQTLASLPGAAHLLVRDIFERLVTHDRTRAIADLSDLEQLAADRTEVRRVVDQLVAARLLVVQTQGAATVELVHESLITGWPTLRRWLDEDQEDAAFVQQLAVAAKQWELKGQAPGLLWRGETAEEARRWAAQRPRRLADREQAFLDAVLGLAKRGQRMRRIALVAAFAVLGAIATGASIAYVRVRAAEQVASEKAVEAHRALAAQQAEERARKEAEDARTDALAALLSEEELRKAAESGLLTAEQLKEIAEARQRVADRARERAEAGLAGAEQRRAQLEANLKKAEADKRAAELAAKQHADEAAMTREQVIEKNRELETALAAAKTAREKAERETARAESLRAEAERTKAQLQKSLDAEKARAEKLERERKKITTDLK